MPTVLLVEDEKPLRAVIRYALAGCGYTILEAGDGREAVRIAEGHGGFIDLLVTDVLLPGIGGRQVAECLQVLNPGMKAICQGSD
jgi:CheY-like chemotaxis protein